MRNKFLLTALVATVIVGMVVYKERHDRKERDEKATNKGPSKETHRWN